VCTQAIALAEPQATVYALGVLATSICLCTALLAADPPTTNQAGFAGVDRLLLAEPRPSGDIVGGLHMGYFQSQGLLRDDAFHERQQYRLYVAWSPLEFLTLGYAHTLTTNYDAGFAPSSRDTLGNPRISAVGSLRVGDTFALGLGAEVWLPTSGVRGLRLPAATPTFTTSFTWRLDAWRFGGNLGYRLDRSEHIFPQKRDPAYEFANDVAFTDVVLFALGGDWTWQASTELRVIPFLEAYFEYSPWVELAKNSLTTTVGTKLELVKTPFQALLGCRVRITGDPQQAGKIPGLPPYEVIAGLAYRFGAEAHFPDRCSTAAECGPGHHCFDGLCLKAYETIVEVEKPVEAPAGKCEADADEFILAGTVVDSKTTSPVSHVRIRVGDAEGVLLSSADDGTFQSCPLPATGGILKVHMEADGYQALDTAVPSGGAGESMQATFELLPASEQFAIIRGSVVNFKGKPVRKCNVTIPATNLRTRTDRKGEFHMNVPVGQHTIQIKCRGYRQQTATLKFERPGEVVVFNADMERR
jgi:hypothetical protein